MSASISPPPPPGAPAWRDRSRGLVGYGWVLVAAGAVCGLLALLSAVFVLFAPPALPTARGALLVNVVAYGALAALLVALGAGSIRARRWSGPIILVVAWCWLALGVMSFLLVALVLPRTMEMAAAPPGAATCGLAIFFFVIVVFLIALPFLLVRFYGREDVRRTLEYRDPRPSWTDAWTPTLLGLLLATAVGAVFAFVGIFAVAAVPFFGRLLTGAAARGYMVVLAAALTLLTYGVWRRSAAAFWGMMLFQAYSLASLLTMQKIDLRAYMEAAGYPVDALNYSMQASLFTSKAFLALLVAFWLALTLFLWTLRGQFRPRGQNA